MHHEHRGDWIENRDLFYVKVKLLWVKNAVIEHTQDTVIYILLLLQMLRLLRALLVGPTAPSPDASSQKRALWLSKALQLVRHHV
jgi:hypothetical protein